MFFATSFSENFFAISMPSSSSAAPATQRHWKFDCATEPGLSLLASLDFPAVDFFAADFALLAFAVAEDELLAPLP